MLQTARIIRMGALVLATLAATGCASIVSKTQRTVRIESTPSGAGVEISNRSGRTVFKGTTPTEMTLKTGAGYFKPAFYTVTVGDPSAAGQVFRVGGQFNAWYVGNLGFGGLIGFLIVDPLTGAMWKIKPELYHVDLERGGVRRGPREPQVEDEDEDEDEDDSEGGPRGGPSLATR